MLETMYAAPGIGLAAPQVGIGHAADRSGLRQGRGGHAPAHRDVHPEVIAESDARNVYEEGCLSIPDITPMSNAPPK